MGNISKLNWFKDNMNKWTNKKLIVFCVGGSPIDNQEIEQFLAKNLKEYKYNFPQIDLLNIVLYNII